MYILSNNNGKSSVIIILFFTESNDVITCFITLKQPPRTATAVALLTPGAGTSKDYYSVTTELE